jgi:REP element-mobilizing transposase RayT
MPRAIRFIPEGGALVEITDRTVQSRFLLVPSPELNDIILGVLGRAQRRHGVELVGFVFLSTHFHLIAHVTDARQLADFMGYLASNLAREIARHTGWTDKIWARRYQAIIISDEEAAQAARLSYLLSHGCKEGLVEQVRDWPGVHCVHALLDGTQAQGSWFDRTKEYGARQRGEEISPRRFATTETVTLSSLPCWQHLAPEVVQQKIRAMVEDIEATAARLRSETQTTFLGPDAVQAQKHESRPARPKKSYAPLFHAFSRRLRRELYDAYHLFLAAFQDASEKLRSGDRNAKFPIGSFPPGLPFVTELPPSCAPG